MFATRLSPDILDARAPVVMVAGRLFMIGSSFVPQEVVLSTDADKNMDMYEPVISPAPCWLLTLHFISSAPAGWSHYTS